MSPATSGWRRLHPASLITRMLTLGRTMLLPGAAVFFFARESGGWEIGLMVIFIPVMLIEVFRFFTLRYRFDEDEIVVRRGYVFRNERHVPYQRIQNIDLVQRPLQRVLKIADVRLETAAGSEPEAVFRSLSMPAVQVMRDRVFAGRPASGDAAPGEEAEMQTALAAPRADSGVPVLRLPMGELVRVGLISGRGVALVAIVIGAAWELDLWERFDLVNRAETLLEEGGSLPSGAMIALVVAVSIPLLMMLSVGWALLRLHGFRLDRHGEDLRLSCGLLTKISATVPRQRIQFVSIRRTLAHRLFGRASIRIETAGGKQDDDPSHSLSEKWLVPIVHPDRVTTLLTHIAPAVDVQSVSWRSLAPRAGRRMVRKGIIRALLLTAIVAVAFRPWGALAAVALVPWAIFVAIAAARITGWSIQDGVVFFRSGVLTRKLSAAPVGRVQVVEVRQSPFDRRWGMATLAVDTAGAGPARHRINVRYLPEEAARAAYAEIAEAAEQAGFVWG